MWQWDWGQTTGHHHTGATWKWTKRQDPMDRLPDPSLTSPEQRKSVSRNCGPCFEILFLPGMCKPSRPQRWQEAPALHWVASVSWVSSGSSWGAPVRWPYGCLWLQRVDEPLLYEQSGKRESLMWWDHVGQPSFCFRDLDHGLSLVHFLGQCPVAALTSSRYK